MTLLVIGMLTASAAWLLWPKGADRLRAFVGPHRRAGTAPRTRHGGEPVSVADLMDELASMLRAGASSAESFAQLAAVHAGDGQAQFTHAVAGRIALGDTPPQAIRSSISVLTADDRRAASGLAAGWQLAAECGVPLSDVLRRHAGSVRADADAGRAREAAMAGPRATVTVLTWLPIGGIGLGMILGAHPLAAFTGSPAGWACLIAGVSLLLLGRRWMAMLMARAGRSRGKAS